MAAAPNTLARAVGPCLLQVFRSASTVAVEAAEWNSARPYEEIPGPKALPIVGNTWRFIPFIGDLAVDNYLDLQKESFKKYGKIFKIEKIRGRKDVVFVADPHDIEKALRNEGPWPIRDGNQCLTYYRTEYRKKWELPGLAVLQGEQWRDLRTRLNPVMMQPRNATQYVEPIDNVAQDMVKRIRDLCDEKNELPGDFIQELYKWALESIALIALDTRLGCLSPDLKPDSEASQLIEAVNAIFDGLYVLDFTFSPYRTFSTPAWKRFVKANEFFDSVAMKYVEKAIERIKNVSHEEERERSVLEQLLIQQRDPTIGIVMALDMLLAGVDTTSHSIANVLYYLSKNQEAQEKLYQEIKQMVPDFKLTPDVLDRLSYLKACLKESMRLSPVAAGNIRENVKEDLVLSNYRIPKGVDLVFPHGMLSNLEEHFPEAGKFKPERWLRTDGRNYEAKSTHPFVYMPFGYGIRMCIGRRFAELEMTALLVRLLQNFRMEYHYGEIKHSPRALMYVDIPLKFRMIERN